MKPGSTTSGYARVLALFAAAVFGALLLFGTLQEAPEELSTGTSSSPGKNESEAKDIPGAKVSERTKASPVKNAAEPAPQRDSEGRAAAGEKNREHSLRGLEELEIPTKCKFVAQSLGLDRESLPKRIEDTYGLSGDFPERGHLVRWERAFGLPGPGAVIWAEWNGDEPPTYKLKVQDGRDPSNWDDRGKAPIEELEGGLPLDELKSQIARLEGGFQKEMGEPSYRRLLVTDEIPAEMGQGASQSAEIINDRVLLFAQEGLSCHSTGEAALSCSCESGH